MWRLLVVALVDELYQVIAASGEIDSSNSWNDHQSCFATNVSNDAKAAMTSSSDVDSSLGF